MQTNPFSPDFWTDLWRQIRLVYYLTRDARTPLPVRLIPFAVIFYLVTPIDLIPAVFPIVGQLDDLALLVLGVKFFLRVAPPELVREYEALL
ncbi:MAG TPA: DUF1232 domain-containing protein [Anaerolineaceae bacterium]|nr:DUF1232 domain-containing protein [Anaerolineaceae bacterium]